MAQLCYALTCIVILVELRLTDGAVVRYVNCKTGIDAGNTCTGSTTPCGSVARALAVVSAHDTVSVVGTCSGRGLSVALPVTFVGQHNSVLDCMGSTCLYFASGATGSVIRNLVLTNALNNETGGAITTVGFLAIENVSVLNCTAFSGAGLYIAGAGGASITNTTFFGNSAIGIGPIQPPQTMGPLLGNGGAIFADCGTVVFMTGCNLTGNLAVNEGAGMYLIESSANISQTNFALNTALGSWGGGAIAAREAQLSVVNTTFRSNSCGVYSAVYQASGDGPGGILASFTALRLQRCLFDANVGILGVWGSAVGVVSPAFVTMIEDCIFVETEGTGFATTGEGVSPVAISRTTFIANDGSVFIDSSSTVISNCTFVANAQTRSSVVVFQGVSALIVDGEFRNNSGDNYPTIDLVRSSCVIANSTMSDARGNSVIFISDAESEAVISRCLFHDNYASLVKGTSAHIQSSTFLRNIALNDAPISVSISSSMTIEDCVFVQNSGVSAGAVLVDTYGALNLTGTIFINNTCRSGGAIHVFYGASVMMSATKFVNNSAELTGGAIHVERRCKSVSIELSHFSGNSAGTAGGGIYALTAIALNSNTFIGNFATSGGGIYIRGGFNAANNTFAGNTGSVGGGVFCFACDMSIDGSTFSNNIAAAEGSAIECEFTDLVDITASVQFTNNKVLTGGAGGATWAAELSQCGGCVLPLAPVILDPSVDCVLTGNRSCRYSCDRGYAPVADGLRCVNGEILPLIACEPIPCPRYVGTVGNATIELDPVAPKTGSRVKFGCNTGLMFLGNDSVTCIGPNWIGTLGHCVPIPCPAIPIPSHARPFLSANMLQGDTITINCQDGYQLIGHQILTCSVGSWGPIPRCQAVPCLDRPSLADGEIKYIIADPVSGASTGDTATFTCNLGFNLLGNTTATCLNGSWVPNQQKCLPKPCDVVLEDPAHGTVYNGSGVLHSVATYECDDGYYIHGAATRCCEAPTWRGDAPTCEPAVCTLPASVSTTTTSNCSQSATVRHGTLCVFECLPGTYPPSTAAAAQMTICRQIGTSAVGNLNPAPSSCTPCLAGSYIIPGDTTCTKCSTTTRTRQVYSTAESDCMCDAGTYESPVGSGLCVSCPTGASCAGDHDQPQALLGYYPADALVFTACNPSYACSGAGNCASGYKGFMCGECEKGFYRLNGNCHPCPTDGAWRLVVAGLACLLAAAILVYLIRPTPVDERTPGFVSVTIIVSCVQVLASFANLDVHWPPFTAFSFDITSFINFNIELASPECVVPMTFYTKVQLHLVLPIAVLAFVFVVFLISVVVAVVKHRSHRRLMVERIKQTAQMCIGAFLFFLTLAYLFVSEAALTIFACDEKASGEFSLTASPSDKCYTPEWRQNAVYAGLGIVFYVVGIPLAVHAVYLRNRLVYGHEVAQNSILSHFLVRKYTSSFWFGDVVVMTRKLGVVLITVFAAGNAYRQVVLCALVMFVSLLFALLLRAYVWRPHRWLDVYTHVATLVVLLCGLFSSDPNTDEGQSNDVKLMDMFSVAAIISCVFFAVSVFFTECMQSFTIRSLEGTLEPFKQESLKIATTPVVAVQFARNGDILVASRDPKQSILRVNSQFWQGTDAPETAASCENILFMHSTHQTIIVATTNFIKQYNAAAKYISSRPLKEEPLCLSGDNNTVVAGHASGYVTIASLLAPAASSSSSGTSTSTNSDTDFYQKSVTRRQCHGEPVTAVALRGIFFYTGAGADIIHWGVDSEESLRAFHLRGLDITCLSESTTHVACGTKNGTVHCIDLKNYATWENRHHYHSIFAVQIDDHLGVVLSASRSKIALSNLKDGTLLQSLPTQPEAGAVTSAIIRGEVAAWGYSSGGIAVHQIKELWNIPQCAEYIRNNASIISRCTRNKSLGDKELAKSVESESVDEDYHDELRLLGDELHLEDVEWDDIQDTRDKLALLTAGLTREAERRFLKPAVPPVTGAPAPMSPAPAPPTPTKPPASKKRAASKAPKAIEIESSSSYGGGGYSGRQSDPSQYSARREPTDYSGVELSEMPRKKSPAAKGKKKAAARPSPNKGKGKEPASPESSVLELEGSGGSYSSLAASNPTESGLQQANNDAEEEPLDGETQPEEIEPDIEGEGEEDAEAESGMEGMAAPRNPLDETTGSGISALSDNEERPLRSSAGSSAAGGAVGLRQRRAAHDESEQSSLEGSHAAVEGAVLHQSSSSINDDRRLGRRRDRQ